MEFKMQNLKGTPRRWGLWVTKETRACDRKRSWRWWTENGIHSRRVQWLGDVHSNFLPQSHVCSLLIRLTLHATATSQRMPVLLTKRCSFRCLLNTIYLSMRHYLNDWPSLPHHLQHPGTGGPCSWHVLLVPCFLLSEVNRNATN